MDIPAPPERPLNAAPAGSRVALLADGPEALRARLAMIDGAQSRLAMQYYLWHGDTAGALIAKHTLAAADRGVAVRILLDDIDAAGLDGFLVAFQAHPRIELKLFNPFKRGWLRPWEILTRFTELNRRMHNKAMVADGAVCVVGGRNIGNAYFGLDQHIGFNDLDILGDGEVAAQTEASFDNYWNCPRSVVISAVGATEPDSGPAVLRTMLDLAAAKAMEQLARLGEDTTEGTDTMRPQPATARAVVIADPPDKSWSRGKRKSDLASRLGRALQQAEKEVIIVSPYFVPRRGVLENLARLGERGVSLRVLTNSQASNDVVVVHAGYAPTRHALLARGVDLFELKPDSGQLRKSGKAKIRFRPSTGLASLHAKVFVIDRTRCFIGSFNLDPRSARLNTEMGIMVDCPIIAGEAAEFALALMDAAYKVDLDGCGRLRWTSADGQTYDRDPHTGVGARLLVRLLGLFPIEAQL